MYLIVLIFNYLSFIQNPTIKVRNYTLMWKSLKFMILNANSIYKNNKEKKIILNLIHKYLILKKLIKYLKLLYKRK